MQINDSALQITQNFDNALVLQENNLTILLSQSIYEHRNTFFSSISIRFSSDYIKNGLIIIISLLISNFKHIEAWPWIMNSNHARKI